VKGPADAPALWIFFNAHYNAKIAEYNTNSSIVSLTISNHSYLEHFCVKKPRNTYKTVSRNKITGVLIAINS